MYTDMNDILKDEEFKTELHNLILKYYKSNEEIVLDNLILEEASCVKFLNELFKKLHENQSLTRIMNAALDEDIKSDSICENKFAEGSTYIPSARMDILRGLECDSELEELDEKNILSWNKEKWEAITEFDFNKLDRRIRSEIAVPLMASLLAIEDTDIHNDLVDEFQQDCSDDMEDYAKDWVRDELGL